MAWIFQCLVWVSLTNMPVRSYNDYIEYSHHLGDHAHSYERDPLQTRRSGNIEPRSYYVTPTERYLEETSGRTQPNERLLPFNFNVQRVQEEKRRRPGQIDEGVRRNGNSSLKIVNNFAKPYPVISNRRGVPAQKDDAKTSLGDTVVFPGPTARRSPFIPQITDENCLRSGICENVPNYPEEQLDEVLKKLEEMNYRFNVDKLDTPEIEQRIGSHKEIALCNSSESVIYPRAVRDTDDQWYLVLNQKRKPQQAFKVEICASKKAEPCNSIIYVDPSSYNTTCIQKHQSRQMVAFDQNGKMVEREFKIPSCCSCAIFMINV